MPVTVTTPTTIIVQDSAARGPIGNTPNISVGTVTTTVPLTPAAVTTAGNSSNVILNFSIPQGFDGVPGAMFYYSFNANTSTESLPNNNYFHCDSPSDQANITILWFNNFDHANANVGNAITTYFNSNSSPKGFLSLRGSGVNQHERIHVSVNDVLLKSGYFQLNVTTLASSTDNIIDNDDLTGFNFSRTGNVGATPIEAYNQANSARDQANTGYGQANAAYGQANASYTQANASYNQANSARDQANTGYGQANAAYAQANAAYNAANSISWVTVPGTSTSVGVAGQAAYESTGNLYICVAENVWSKFIGTTSW